MSSSCFADFRCGRTGIWRSDGTDNNFLQYDVRPKIQEAYVDFSSALSDWTKEVKELKLDSRFSRFWCNSCPIKPICVSDSSDLVHPCGFAFLAPPASCALRWEATGPSANPTYKNNLTLPEYDLAFMQKLGDTRSQLSPPS